MNFWSGGPLQEYTKSLLEFIADLSGGWSMSCANMSLPSCMVFGGNPQKALSLAFDVQIETRLKHQIQQESH